MHIQLSGNVSVTGTHTYGDFLLVGILFLLFITLLGDQGASTCAVLVCVRPSATETSRVHRPETRQSRNL